jgi:hypothetical protein
MTDTTDRLGWAIVIVAIVYFAASVVARVLAG